MKRFALAAMLTAAWAAPATAEPPAATVRLHEVGAGAGAGARRFVGRVEPLRTVELSFEVSGQMVEIPVRSGEIVPQGGLIAAIDPEDFTLALREAEARRDLAQLEFDRARDLTSRGAAPQSRRDEAVAELRLAEVAYDVAARNIRLTRIAAPFDALVARRLVDAFSYVTPEAPVVRVQDVSEMRVAISAPEDLIPLVRDPGAFSAVARLAALPGEPIPLELREFVTEADPVAQTYEIVFALTGGRDPRVLPGMTATVEIRPKGLDAGRAPVIPATAVDADGEDGFRVWLFEPEADGTGAGVVRPRTVRLGLAEGDGVPVLEGLAAGEVIVSAGVSRLREGMRVRPMNL
ncbi:MAG: efflux RND transporter periplasmic adaptor subunit [Rhodobacteraceae bacterium]|nr:MAG: efflux RND transporter periplasmic adaptor subunit [Paracoccaceae bacterium]